jgi:hypothetical protein
MNNIPDNMLPESVLKGLYNPQFTPEDKILNEQLIDPAGRKQEIHQRLQEKLSKALTPDPPIGSRNTSSATDRGIPRPLTEEEAEEIDRYIESLKERVAATRTRIADLRKFIDETANPSQGNELAFKVDISKKGSLKRAVRKVFGEKTDTITYSMYKAALEQKRLIEEQESDGYVNGTFEEDEDE